MPVHPPAARPGRLLCDLDETICPCGRFCVEAEQGFLALMTRVFGPRGAAERAARFRALDWAHAQGAHGVSRGRYAHSMQVLYAELCAARDRAPDPSVQAECAAHGARPFRDPADYTPFPGVLQMLATYRQHGWGLGLYTKGDEQAQWDLKIRPHGLEQLFGAIRVRPEMVKTPEVFRSLAAELQAQGYGGAVTVVGDSLKDDVGVGAAAGFRTVWVREGHAAIHASWNHDAGHERQGADAVIERLSDLPTVLPPVPVPVPPVRATPDAPGPRVASPRRFGSPLSPRPAPAAGRGLSGPRPAARPGPPAGSRRASRWRPPGRGARSTPRRGRGR